ncbi:MAG: hypothetical protein IJ390_12740 [Lachnospiraceae bacterium]|nr:hypothetical protein [Lachnospiraceae bacterium]
MREIRDRIITEGWTPQNGSLTFSVKQVEVTAALGEVVEGFFEISKTDGGMPEGFVKTLDERMQCLTPFFSGGTERIEYRFDAAGMEEDETRSGRFFVVSNYGEYELAWKVTAKSKPVNSSLGEIRNLFHFTNLARANWQEAVKLFYTKEFKRICGEEQEELYNMYRGFSRYYGNENNVEEFLIAVHKKQPITFSTITKEINIPEIRGRISEDILIQKNGWGPVHLQVETKGSFLTVEKTWLGEDDFLGNQCRIPVFMDESRMHEGRNFGEIIISYVRGKMIIPVTVMMHAARMGRQDRRQREWKKCNFRMVKLYLDYRMKRMDLNSWRIAAKECTEQMARLTEKNAVPKLFWAQLLMTEEKMDEAGWILEKVQDWVMEAEPAVYCYYLYLTTLYNREPGYVKEATREVEEIFAQNPGEWRIAWLLLFLSRSLSRNAAAKWNFLETQFRAGCTSPVLYLEAMQLLNAAPTLLMKLDEVTKQVIMYGARNGICSRDLMGYVVSLINREKYYDPLLFEILQHFWKKQEDMETLQAICTLLIKGGKTGSEYYPWYLKGVENNLRITRLYEHYLMSLDLNKDVEIPKIALLYFAYQSNLDYEYAAYLYAYVEKHKLEDQDLYITYRPEMDRFLLAQLHKGRVNRHLAYLYCALLNGEMLTPENAAALAPLLTRVEIECAEEKGRLIVVNARLKGEKIIQVRKGIACAELCSRQDMIFVEDDAQNRRLLEEKARVIPLFPNGVLRQEVAQYAGDCLSFHLSGSEVEQVNIRKENADSYLMIAREPALTGVYRQRVRIGLLHYLFEEDRTEELDTLLKETDTEDIAIADRVEAVRYLVLQGFYEKAYAWMKGVDPERVDARILLRLCSRLLEQGIFTDTLRMTKLCFSAALRGKYDGNMLAQLIEHYEGSVREMEVLMHASEGFGISTFSLCERILEQLLYTGKDVTEQMPLLRQYVSEGGRCETEIAVLYRCAYSYVIAGQPIHTYMIQDILRLIRLGEHVPDMCRIACLQYFSRNRSAMDMEAEKLIKQMGEELLAQNRLLPVLREFTDILPGAAQLLDKTFVVYLGKQDDKAILNYRILQENDADEDYRSEEMRHVYGGIYTMSFILFPGESLQYFITEAQNRHNIVESGILKAEEIAETGSNSRYGMLSRVSSACLEALQMKEKQGQSLELLNQYLYTEFCANELFEMMQ